MMTRYIVALVAVLAVINAQQTEEIDAQDQPQRTLVAPVASPKVTVSDETTLLQPNPTEVTETQPRNKRAPILLKKALLGGALLGAGALGAGALGAGVLGAGVLGAGALGAAGLYKAKYLGGYGYGGYDYGGYGYGDYGSYPYYGRYNPGLHYHNHYHNYPHPHYYQYNYGPDYGYW